MQLNPKEFDRRFLDKSLKLAFIGMSNIGKSYTARRLQDAIGFDLIEIDALLQKELGHKDMEAFAKWQGQPYEDGYSEREAHSITLETKALKTAMSSAKGNVIIDTPGSVIYTDPSALEKLQNEYWIVYIKANPNDLERLKSDYFTTPKPLIWNNFFKRDFALTPRENIKNCFPNLLNARAKTYARLANATLDSDFIIDPATTPQMIFDALRPSVE